MYAVDVGILVARPQLGIKTIEELIERAKQKPDELSYASAGPGTVTHVSTELFKHAAGIRSCMCRFADPGRPRRRFSAAMSRSCPRPIRRPSRWWSEAMSFRSSPRRARRLPDLPNVPTLAEKGFGGTEVNIWMGFFMPAATPQPIVQKFTNAVAEASRKPALKAAIEKTGMILDYGDPARISQLLQQEHANVSKLAQVVDLGT